MYKRQDQSYLSHALGINPQLEIDYQTLPVEKGDVFVFSTDGVPVPYTHLDVYKRQVDGDGDVIDVVPGDLVNALRQAEAIG